MRQLLQFQFHSNKVPSTGIINWFTSLYHSEPVSPTRCLLFSSPHLPLQDGPAINTLSLIATPLFVPLRALIALPPSLIPANG